MLTSTADPVPGVFNTGVDAAGNSLVAGAVDPHWKLVSSADTRSSGPNVFVVNSGFPFPAWFSDSPSSGWIAPMADQTTGNAAGNYTYRLAFGLGGFDPATATLTVRAAFDNQGMAVLLNGLDTGVKFVSNGAANYQQFSPNFTINKGFVAGVNTLDIVVSNWSNVANPTGFRAEVSATAALQDSPPVFTVQPQDANAVYKKSLSLSATVSGSVPLYYQWFHDGVSYSGATNSQWTLAAAGITDAGRYWIVASNVFGVATSRVASVTVRAPNPAERTYEPPGPSSRASGIAITEIMYHPGIRADGKDLEFIELYNSNPFFEDLSGWQLAGDIGYTFPSNSILAGNAYLVVAAKPADMASAYGLTNVTGPYSKHLSNGTGSVRLVKRSGGVVLNVAYSDHAPWPAAADGAGPSLVLARPSYGEGDARAWAASARRGGSPGGPDPVPGGLFGQLVINEVLANPPPGFPQYIEVRNNGIMPANLSGCVLQDASGARSSTVPPDSVLASGDVAVFTDSQLGFHLNPSGDAIFLADSSMTQILDGVRFDGQLSGLPWGRFPVGAPAFQLLSAATAGAANSPPFASDIIINEIGYNPLAGGNDAEFVELFNRGLSGVELTGWTLQGEVGFNFPSGTYLPAGGYLVVARNIAWLAASNPPPASSILLGNYTGKLANGGGHLALARPEVVVLNDPVSGLPVTNSFPAVVNEVTYLSGGLWGDWSGGGGSTLELTDFRADGRLAENWSASDETAKALWTMIEYTGVLDMPHPSIPAADQVQIMLLGAGEALVDDVEVLVDGSNRVTNGTFEGGVGGWLLQGTHRLSHWESGEGYQSGHSLHLVATDRGENEANRVASDLSSTIPVGVTATIRARVRWLAGHPEILVRLRNGALEASGSLPMPANLGTPGRRNSRWVSNAPPVISETTHWPVLPAGGETVRVTARVTDSDGLSSVLLRYRIDPSSSFQSIPMVDDGSGPDEYAGDGIFTATLPSQPTGVLVAFHIVAADGSPIPASTTYPPSAPTHECLVRFGEVPSGNAYGTYRLWLTAATHQYWSDREKFSNEDVDATFVYGTNRVVYRAGSRYSGSPYSAIYYTTPTGALCGYNIDFPATEPFLGTTGVVLDWPIRDDTDQREQIMFWFLEQYGLPNMYRRYINLDVNGVHRGSIYDDVQQPGGEVVNEWFSSNNQGNLWKTDCWNESTDQAVQDEPCVLNSLQNYVSGGVKKVSRYRWSWRPRSSGSSANDYSTLFSLVDLANTNSQYAANMQAGIDIDQWMRTFAMNDLGSYWDAFGNFNSKNTFLYLPANDKWKLICWDMDVGMGVVRDPPDAPLFEYSDPTFDRIYGTPALVRPYWAALQEALNGFFQLQYINPILDAKFAAFQANGIGLNSPADIKTWITQRREFLLKQFTAVDTTFAITSNGGRDFTSTNESVTLAGRAPVTVASVKINGITTPVNWDSVTNWSVVVRLLSGTNDFEITGYDRLGNAIPGSSGTIRISYAGAVEPIAAIRINEWMASNQTAVVDPASNSYDDWFELYNAGTSTVDLTGFSLSNSQTTPGKFVIPPGFSVAPKGFLMVWANNHPEQSVPGVALHVNFKLSKAGAEIALFDPLGRLVDSVLFGPQVADISEGRWGDGELGGSFVLSAPSPGSPNLEPPPGTVTFGLHASPGNAPGLVVIGWEGLAGRQYQIQFRGQLAGDTWRALGDPIPSGGGQISFTDTLSAADSARFYRIVLLP